MKPPKEELFVETVTEKFCGCIVASDIRPATKADVAKAKRLHKAGHCPHNIVKDEDCWPYWVRSCATCGKGLGLV